MSTRQDALAHALAEAAIWMKWAKSLQAAVPGSHAQSMADLEARCRADLLDALKALDA